MAIIFDGRGYARKVTEELKARVASMSRKPKLVTILNPEDRGSVVYTNLKAKKAGELGIQFEKFQFEKFDFETIFKLIDDLNNDKAVDGIMIQLPFGGDREKELIELISPQKDVDGLREDSPFVPATVRAVMEILGQALQATSHKPQATKLGICVVGANGEVGKGVMKQLAKTKYEVTGMGRGDFDVEKIKNADVVISVTGQVGLIGPEMIKLGAVCIDVGYPGGDFDPKVAEKAAFFTPVPGGVGPVTVTMLFANLIGSQW